MKDHATWLRRSYPRSALKEKNGIGIEATGLALLGRVCAREERDGCCCSDNVIGASSPECSRSVSCSAPTSALSSLACSSAVPIMTETTSRRHNDTPNRRQGCSDAH